jgi:hypothetical protein
MRSTFLFFDTDFTAEFVRAKIKNGKVLLKDGEHIVDKTKPFMLKSTLAPRPLYLMKWNSVYPMTFEVKETIQILKDVETGKEFQLSKKELVPADTSFYEKGGAGYSPEILKTTGDVRFLKGMKKYSEGKGMEAKSIITIILFIVLIIGGGFLMYMLLSGQLGIKLF